MLPKINPLSIDHSSLEKFMRSTEREMSKSYLIWFLFKIKAVRL